MTTNQTRTSNYEQQLKRPKPPSPEMVKKAQPFRADLLGPIDAITRDPNFAIRG
jgi:hypothetical protein